ncbi:hypothetical protein FRC11_014141 [Ceratobasidium sp. 423]|nr:hypothetical protein FRC11_014141 [Ceratobasidium sp. 423]
MNHSCTHAVDTLGCLRGLDQATIAAGDTQKPRPVIDGTLLTQRPRLSLAKKQVNGERLVSLHNADEGRVFVTQDTNSTVRSWIVEQFPRLNDQNITAVEGAYSVFATNDMPEAENIYKMQTMIFGEAIFVCPSVWLANAFSKASYKGIFAVPPALHSFDVAVYFPDIQYSFIQLAQPISKSLTQSFMGALVSFILTGSPNNNPMSQSVNPDWPVYDPTDPMGMVFNITTSGAADPEHKRVDSALRQRCSLWAELALFTQQ